jgi:hypothetical protein
MMVHADTPGSDAANFPGGPARRSLSIVGPVVLLGLMAFLAGGAALRESATIDEVAHIGAGLSYWQTLDLRMNEEHPPLAKLLAALPLALRGTRADYSSISWRESAKFFPGLLGEWVFGDWVVTQWNPSAPLLAWARLPMLALTLALGGVLFRYACRLGGLGGGLLCLVVYVSAPVFLTFGPLVLTDTVVTLFSLLTLWQCAETWRDPCGRNVQWLGGALAGALLSKFSAGILLLALLTFAISTRFWPIADQPATRVEARSWRRLRWRAVRKGVFLAGVLVYVVYFVFSWNQAVDIPGFDGKGPLIAGLGRVLMPPWLYLRGLAIFLLTSSRPTFLLGEWHAHGVWFYFPVMFALKSSLGFIGLLLLALGLLAGRRSGTPHAVLIPEALVLHWRLLWVALLVFTLICVLSPMNISVRHFSIPIILLMLLLAPVPRMLDGLTSRFRTAGVGLTAALALGCLVTAVRSYPFYMPYVNALGLGHPAYALANDSNVDWNQALPEVERFAREHGLAQIPLDEYGLSHIASWVPQATSWNCQIPGASDSGRWVAVSANMILDSHNCAWLLRYPNEALGGGSVYAFHLPDPIPPAGAPGGPPLPGEYHQFPTMRNGMDMRVILMEAVWHPEKIPEIIARMKADWEKAKAAKKK